MTEPPVEALVFSHAFPGCFLVHCWRYDNPVAYKFIVRPARSYSALFIGYLKRFDGANDFIHVPADFLRVVHDQTYFAFRVNDEYGFDLLKDLKYDAGISIRAMAAELPVRFDVAVGDEGLSMWVMIRQPFDF